MRLECKCGLRNRPAALKCAACGRVLQSPDDAARRQREWNALPPDLRKSMEADFATRERHHSRAFSGRRQRLIVLAVISAVLYPVLLYFVPPRATEASLLAIPIGLLAALTYHAIGPGAIRGLLIFSLAYVGATALKFPFLPTTAGFAMGQWLFAALMTFIVAILGFAVGFNDSRD